MSRFGDLIGKFRGGDGQKVATYPCLITAINRGAALPHGPASGYSYDILMNAPQGALSLTDIAPVVQRWPDTMDVVPLKVNSMTMVGVLEGTVTGLLTAELPYVEPCGQSSGSVIQDQIAGFIGLAYAMTPGQKAQLRGAMGL